jgi:hypothetical protein
MMAALSALLGVATGGFSLRWLVYPVMGLLAITGGHVLIENWKEGYRRDGERRCDSRWEQSIREEERNRASEAAATSRSILEAERKTNEDLTNEIERIAQEANRLRALSGGNSDGRCLSDGVLDALGRHGDRKGGSEPRAKQARPPGPSS